MSNTFFGRKHPSQIQEALELVQECLDDWPYAAVRVVQIMHRLERVKAILESYDSDERVDLIDEENVER